MQERVGRRSDEYVATESWCIYTCVYIIVVQTVYSSMSGGTICAWSHRAWYNMDTSQQARQTQGPPEGM